MDNPNDYSKEFFLLGWNKITNKCNFDDFFKSQELVEYSSSLIFGEFSNFYYKKINNCLFVAKPIFNFNNYLITICYKPISLLQNEPIPYDKILSMGISIKGNLDFGKKNKFGEEYIYDCADFLEMKGSRYTPHRNRIKFFLDNQSDFEIRLGANDDILKIIESWEKIKKSKTQLRLYKIALNNLDRCTIVTTYYKGSPLGFSIVENINDRNGIIVQRLINYESNYKGEVNFILHYNDCVIHKGKKLNIGGSRNEKIKIAKQKLRPIMILDIKKQTTKVKLNREDYLLIKGN